MLRGFFKPPETFAVFFSVVSCVYRSGLFVFFFFFVVVCFGVLMFPVNGFPSLVSILVS